MVFTIRTYFIPVTKMTDEPYVPGRLASGIKSWDEDVAKYKGRARWGDVLIPWLEEQHRRQMEGGLREEDEELVFKYPYQSGLQ